MELHEWLQIVDRPVTAMAKSYPAGYDGYLHQHERAQLLYAVSGSIRMTFDLGCWVIPPQRAVWIPPGMPHQTGSIGPMEMRTLYVRPGVCPALAPQMPRMIRVSTLLRELILRITGMPVEYDLAGQDAQIIAATLGEIDWTPLNPISLPPLQDGRLREMERTLSRLPSDRSSLDAWAARLAISPRTLTRLISKETAMSFQAWRDRIRTFTALPLLAEGVPLVEIADLLGYETAWSFTAMFKRVTGTPPSRYFDKEAAHDS